MKAPAESAEERMLRGYRDGLSGRLPACMSAAYRHGYENGLADARGIPHEYADVLRRRAGMIEGISAGQEG